MATNDPPVPARRAGFLGWFGLGRYPHDEDAHAPDETAFAVTADARPGLIGAIGRFLVAHHLEVSSFTLGIAHDYLTGQDEVMGRLIDQHVQANAPITVPWLQSALHDTSPDDDRQAMSALMGELQSNLEEFGRTTTAAKSAASDYHSALEVQVDEIRRTDITGAVIADLALLAKAMLDRTRELEKEMSRSDLQTRTLQRSLDQARRTAECDHLTGLPNRRAFEARLASEYSAAQYSGQPLCIAFCDIDHFKAINDTHGHEAGDRILKTVAKALAGISSDQCHVARHGGEEFVVLFSGLSVAQCCQILDDTRAQQAERRLVNRATDIPFGKVTFSAGVADICAFPDPRAALRAADQALYRAKEEGRNRVLVAHPARHDIAPEP